MSPESSSDYRLDVVAIGSIVERPGLRNTTDDLASLEKSIRELGLLFPLLVNRSNVLISGHRRLEACRRIGLREVPVLRIEADENGLRALNMLVHENLCRRDLNPDELESLIDRKKELFGRARRRNPLRGLAERFRQWRRKSGPGAQNGDGAKDGH